MAEMIQSHAILKYQQNQNYPYIVLPPELVTYLEGPNLPRKPVVEKPSLPIKPPYPEVPKVPQKVLDKLTALASTGAGIIALTAIIAAELPFFIIAAGFAGVLALAKFAYDSFIYEKEMEHYEKVELPKYKKECEEYPQKVKKWEEMCNEIETKHKLKVKKDMEEHEIKIQETIRRWEQGKNLPPIQSNPLDTHGNAREGLNDRTLRNKIECELIKTDLPDLPHIKIELLPIGKGLSIPGYDFPYTPDIAIKVSGNNKNLFFDIENDEPWYRDRNGDKQPYHILDSDNQINRDQYFIESGWIVIRFSEKQICEQSDECVKLIIDLILAFFKPGMNKLSNKLIIQERWNSDNATMQWRPL